MLKIARKVTTKIKEEDDMRQTIYVDILLGINLIIDYFILKLEARLFSLDVKRGKIILSASIGSIFSLFIFFDNLGIVLSFFIKVLMSMLMIVVAFKRKNLKTFFKLVIVFYLINFLFGGMIFFIWYFYSPRGIYIKNGMIYFNVSPVFLILSTGIIYLILKVYYNLWGDKTKYLGICKIKIKNDYKEVTLRGKIDTGNDLREPFSNIAVIVSEFNCVEPVLSEGFKNCIINFYKSSDNTELLYQKDCKKLRLIPFDTISNSGVLLSFIPDEITIEYQKNSYKVKAYLAISNKKTVEGDFQALVNPELIL